MDEIKNEISGAYFLVATLNVSGDAVDVVAAIRQKLKKATKLLEDMEANDG